MKLFQLIGCVLLSMASVAFASCDDDEDMVLQPTQAEIMIKYL